MNLSESPPAWVPTLTEEILLSHASVQPPPRPTAALVNHFPSELDEARLCMMVTDQLMAQLPDLIRATVRDILLQQTAHGMQAVQTPQDPERPLA